MSSINSRNWMSCWSWASKICRRLNATIQGTHGDSAAIHLVAGMLAQPRQPQGPRGARAPRAAHRGAALVDPGEEDAEAALEPSHDAEEAEAPCAVPPPPLPPPAALPADERDEMSQMAREVELPRWDARTGQFRNPSDNVILGRARVLKAGMPGETIAVYCRLHQCYPPIRPTRRALPEVTLARWFAADMELPRGPDGRAQHMALFRELEEAHNRGE